MSGEYPEPDIGDRVTYIDGDGNEHRAIVVSDCPGGEYITVVTGAQGELGEEYNHDVDAHSSTHPHVSVYENGSKTYAFTLGWS